MDSIKKITEKIKKFRDERDWAKYHNHKDMALSLVLEAAELLEHFQWKSPDEIEEHVRTDREEIADEIADTAMYLFELADNLGINLSGAIESKIRKNGEKYPVERSKGRHTKYDRLQATPPRG